MLSRPYTRISRWNARLTREERAQQRADQERDDGDDEDEREGISPPDGDDAARRRLGHVDRRGEHAGRQARERVSAQQAQERSARSRSGGGDRVTARCLYRNSLSASPGERIALLRKYSVLTAGVSAILPPLAGDCASSVAGVVIPGDFGSGNSNSSGTGVTGLGANKRVETARGFCNRGGRVSGVVRFGSISTATEDLRRLRGGTLRTRANCG